MSDLPDLEFLAAKAWLVDPERAQHLSAMAPHAVHETEEPEHTSSGQMCLKVGLEPTLVNRQAIRTALFDSRLR